jgi:hypothetical protein
MHNNFIGLYPRRSALARCLNVTILTLAIAMCGFLPSLAVQPAAGRVRDARNGFSFVPPSGWEASGLRPEPTMRFLYLGPTYKSFRANVNLIVDTDTGESFDEIARQIKEMYPGMFNGWKLAEEAPLEINGKKSYYISFTHRSGGHTIKQAQFLVLGGNGKVYVVTFAAMDIAFEGLRSAIAQSALSIKIE